MTENETTPDARAIAAGLTEREREALGELSATDKRVVYMLNTLLDKQLVKDCEGWFGWEEGYRHYYALTDLGRAVLAALDNGEAARSGKPQTITAKQFVEEGYAENNQCKVALQHLPHSFVLKFEKSLAYDGYFAHYMNMSGQSDCVFIESDYELLVTWLTTASEPQPAPQPTATERANPAVGEDDTDDDVLIGERVVSDKVVRMTNVMVSKEKWQALQQDLATVRAERDAAQAENKRLQRLETALRGEQKTLLSSLGTSQHRVIELEKSIMRSLKLSKQSPELQTEGENVLDAIYKELREAFYGIQPKAGDQ